MKTRAILQGLLDAARQQPALLLARPESHPAGALLGVGGTVLGVLAYRSEWAWRDAVAAVALAAVLLGLVLHGVWRRAGAGWWVDFPARSVRPEGQRAETTVIDGEGWSIATAPGERRFHVAIDLRHRDRGRVVRLLDQPAIGSRTIGQISALADVLAERLRVERSGPRV